MSSTSSGSTSTAAPPATSSVAVPARGHHRRALRHRLQHRQAEALAQARVGEDLGTGVQRAQLGRRSRSRAPGRSPAGAAASPQPLGPARTSSRSGARPSRSNAATSRAQVLAGLERADEQQVGPVEAELLAGVGHLLGRGPLDVRRPAARGAAGRRRRRAPRQSASVAIDEHSTRSASRRTSSRPRWKIRSPRRVKWSGSWRKARSCTVTTSGADRGGTTIVVAWTTSTRPGRQLDRGPPQPVPRLVERGPRQRQRAHRHRPVGTPSGGGPPVGRAHTDDLHVAAVVDRATTSSAATAVPPGTRCQHCSRVTADAHGRPSWQAPPP